MSISKECREIVDLIISAKKGNKEDFCTLLEKYHKAISHVCNRYHIKDLEFEDKLSICHSKLWKDLHMYNESKGTFFVFLYTLCKRALQEALRFANIKRHCPEGEVVSLDYTIVGGLTVSDTLEAKDENLDNKEEYRFLEDKLLKVSSKLEIDCYLLYKEKYSYDEIAKKLGVSEKSVDNALSRIKDAGKEIYNKYITKEKRMEQNEYMRDYMRDYNNRPGNVEKRKEYYEEHKDEINRKKREYRKKKRSEKKNKMQEIQEIDDLLLDPVKNGQRIEEIVHKEVKKSIEIKENDKKKKIVEKENLVMSNDKENKVMLKRVEELWANYGKLLYRKNIILEEEKRIMNELNDLSIKLKE